MRVDSTLVTTWTSSGTTVNFEGIELSGYSGQHVTITGVLADMEWLSIVEVSACHPANDCVWAKQTRSERTPSVSIGW